MPWKTNKQLLTSLKLECILQSLAFQIHDPQHFDFFPRYIKNSSVIINSTPEVVKCYVWYTPEFQRKSPNLPQGEMIGKGFRARQRPWGECLFPRDQWKCPRVDEKTGSGAADLEVSGLNCLRWGQHSKNPVGTSLPECPSFLGMDLQLHRKKMAEAFCTEWQQHAAECEPPTSM